MADVTLYQWSQDMSGGPYPGWFLYTLKDHLVTNGWTVVGSGDGLSRFGHEDSATTVPEAQRGSGGQYDCWSSGGISNGVAGSAANQLAWAHLRNPSGNKDLILTSTDNTTKYHGRVGFTRQGIQADGSSANATTFPTVTTADEIIWAKGSAATDNSLYPPVTDAGDITYVDLTVLDGGDEWILNTYHYDAGLASYEDDGSSGWFGVVSIENPHPDDTDPWVVLSGTPDLNQFRAWDYVDGAIFTGNSTHNAPLNDSRRDPDTVMILPLTFGDTGGANSVAKGVLNRDMLAGSDFNRVWGDRITEAGSGRVYIWSRPDETDNHLIRWPSTSVGQTGATYTDETGWDPYYLETATEAVAPSAALVSPPVSTPLGVNDVITFDVTDASGLGAVLIAVEYPDLPTEVAWIDSAETAFYAVSRAAITDGFRYTVRRRGGWIASPTIKVFAVDSVGNVL